MAMTTWPASEKQLAFVGKLMGEKVVPDGFVLPEDPTGKEASAAIELLLKAPRKVAETPLVQTGYYLLGDQVYVVVKSRQSERRYAKKQVLIPGKQCQWNYEPGGIAKLAAALPLTLTEAAQFGHMHGYCLCCGRNLSDPKSVTAGIGPVCAKKFA